MIEVSKNAPQARHLATSSRVRRKINERLEIDGRRRVFSAPDRGLAGTVPT